MLNYSVVFGFVLVCIAQARFFRGNSGIVQIKTRIVSHRRSVMPGTKVELACEVFGDTTSEVYWSKNGILLDNLPASDNILINGPQLTIQRANVNDNGFYGCYAQKGNYSTVYIEVSKPHPPPSCKDDPKLADCNLIVKSKLCHHEYYSIICCNKCVMAGYLIPEELDTQADAVV